jgi:hypothetical protein
MLNEVLKVLRNIVVTLLAFLVGVLATGGVTTLTTLEVVSREIEQFEGRRVTVETYATYDNISGWAVGEPFEKPERYTSLELEEYNVAYEKLADTLAPRPNDKSYFRVKVIVTGLVEDNCNDGVTCCFGETMTLRNAKFRVLTDPEIYTIPVK